MLDAPVITLNGNLSVTKGTTSKASSPYPKYFYKPKDNMLDVRRGSRYDSSKPKSFHLTQPDANLAKFLF